MSSLNSNFVTNCLWSDEQVSIVLVQIFLIINCLRSMIGPIDFYYFFPYLFLSILPSFILPILNLKYNSSFPKLYLNYSSNQYLLGCRSYKFFLIVPYRILRWFIFAGLIVNFHNEYYKWLSCNLCFLPSFWFGLLCRFFSRYWDKKDLVS